MQFLKEQVLLSVHFQIQGKKKQKIHFTNANTIGNFHVEASINNFKMINNYAWRSSFLTKFIEKCESP